jgi:hypothetical protein
MMAALPQTSPAPLANQTVALVSAEGYETFTATALTGTSPIAVYTAAASAQRRITKVRKLVVVNTTAGAISITVTYRLANTTDHVYYPATSLAAGGRIVFDDMEMTLSPDDVLRVTGNTGVNVFVSAREYQGNVKG